jgi:hypothetical protein
MRSFSHFKIKFAICLGFEVAEEFRTYRASD